MVRSFTLRSSPSGLNTTCKGEVRAAQSGGGGLRSSGQEAELFASAGTTTAMAIRSVPRCARRCFTFHVWLMQG